jgi:hypothetical protein
MHCATSLDSVGPFLKNLLKSWMGIWICHATRPESIVWKVVPLWKDVGEHACAPREKGSTLNYY